MFYLYGIVSIYQCQILSSIMEILSCNGNIQPQQGYIVYPFGYFTQFLLFYITFSKTNLWQFIEKQLFIWIEQWQMNQHSSIHILSTSGMKTIFSSYRSILIIQVKKIINILGTTSSLKNDPQLPPFPKKNIFKKK